MKSAIRCALGILSGALVFLLTTDSLAQPAAPATNQAASRVLIITGGHDHTPFGHPSYRALVPNSILWTASKLK